jgi:hypothetical protein
LIDHESLIQRFWPTPMEQAEIANLLLGEAPALSGVEAAAVLELRFRDWAQQLVLDHLGVGEYATDNAERADEWDC